MFVLFLYIFLRNLSQSQKSLEEYFSSPFRCIYSIYIHSWAHIWHPFRKASFLIVWKECLTSISSIQRLIQPLNTSKGSSIIGGFSKSNTSKHNIFQFKLQHSSLQTRMLTSDPRLYGTGNHVWTLCSRRFAPLPWHIWFNSTEMTLNQTIQLKVIWQKLFPYSTRQRHLSSWQEIWYVQDQGQRSVVHNTFQFSIYLNDAVTSNKTKVIKDIH